MGSAVAAHDRPDRPGWLETILVLGVCGVLLQGVYTLDTHGREREAARAQQVLAERAQQGEQRARREALRARAGSSPIMVPAGPAWGPASSVVSHTQTSAPATARAGSDSETALLLLMGCAGLAMCGAGLRLLSRRSA